MTFLKIRYNGIGYNRTLSWYSMIFGNYQYQRKVDFKIFSSLMDGCFFKKVLAHKFGAKNNAKGPFSIKYQSPFGGHSAFQKPQ